MPFEVPRAAHCVCHGFTLVVSLALVVGCGGSRTRNSSADLEIAPDVITSTNAEPGGIVIPGFSDDHRGDQYVVIYLGVPDGSPVLQFTNPLADVTVVSQNSRIELRELKCSLQVESGIRSFRFSPTLTQQQIKTLKSIRVTRLYDQAGEPT